MTTQYKSSNSLKSTIQQQLSDFPGFSTLLKLQPDELQKIKQQIEYQWFSRIQEIAPEQAGEFKKRGIAHYHELSHRLDHGSIWSRNHRLLSESAVVELRKTSLFQQLELTFGSLLISDEEHPGKEVVHWRLVRPHQLSDVGPIHADKWFWDLNNWPVPANTHRVKVWIAIYTEPGLSGLRVVPDSQQKTWQYQPAKRHGVLKPLFDCKENQISPQLVNTRSGEAIIFHDQLLHGGAINRGTLTRVSLEFTLFVSN